MQVTCRTHTSHMKNTCRSHAYLMQIMCRSLSDLVQSTETMQIPCRSHAHLVQITCRPHADCMQITCRSHADHMQIQYGSRTVHTTGSQSSSRPSVSQQQSIRSKQFVFCSVPGRSVWRRVSWPPWTESTWQAWPNCTPTSPDSSTCASLATAGLTGHTTAPPRPPLSSGYVELLRVVDSAACAQNFLQSQIWVVCIPEESQWPLQTCAVHRKVCAWNVYILFIVRTLMAGFRASVYSSGPGWGFRNWCFFPKLDQLIFSAYSESAVSDYSVKLLVMLQAVWVFWYNFADEIWLKNEYMYIYPFGYQILLTDLKQDLPYSPMY